jgi:hypothetical protein
MRDGAELNGYLWSIRVSEWAKSSTKQQQHRLLSEAYPKLGKALGIRDLNASLVNEDKVWLSW